MTKQKEEVEGSGSCWLCPTETKNKWKDLHTHTHTHPSHLRPLSVYKHRKWENTLISLFFPRPIFQMPKHVVEITTLHNKSSPQYVMIGNGFSGTFYSSVLSQCGSWLPRMRRQPDKCWISTEMASRCLFQWPAAVCAGVGVAHGRHTVWDCGWQSHSRPLSQAPKPASLEALR